MILSPFERLVAIRYLGARKQEGFISIVALFSLIGSWNSFMWPLVVTNSVSKRIIQVGLAYFSTEQGTQYTLMMAAATFCIAPLLAIFFVAQKQIISSFARSGLKE